MIQSSTPKRSGHARIVSIPDECRCLDTIQINRLEQSFRKWAEGAQRADVRLSRRRVLLIFLLIRYTAGKLNEVLALNPFQDIDIKHHIVFLGKGEKKVHRAVREVRIPEALSEEIKSSLNDADFRKYMEGLFKVDPGHVRRKFYERAKDSGFPPAMGSPESIRKSRAVELMQSNMPLPVVQKMLGHSTLNMTASYVDFSEADMQQVAKHFIERESHRKTSARNSFFGKITSIKKGDIQAKVHMSTLSGDKITTIITNDSLSGLGLKEGSMITAEVKAPWVILQKSGKEPESTAENRFAGTITRITKGRITTEYVVRISDGTELCSIVSAENARLTGFKENDQVWAVFNSFSVVLHTD
jgi:molybdate transport system regulatory protein